MSMGRRSNTIMKFMRTIMSTVIMNTSTATTIITSIIIRTNTATWRT